MKALPFRIPKDSSSSLHLQIDDDEHFYDKLHQHSEYQLTLIEQGRGTLIHGTYVGPFEPGDIFLIGGGISHLFRSDLHGQTRAVSRSVFFDFSYLKSHLGALREYEKLFHAEESIQRGGRATGALKPILGSQILSIFDEKQPRSLHVLLEVISSLPELTEWKWFDPLSPKKLSEFQGKRLDQVFDHALKNYKKSINLEEVANIANMNVSSFCRYFKLHTRRSYVSFLNEYRVQQACNLLARTEQSILNVAMDTGFNNLSNFNRQFKKFAHCTPSEYKKKLNAAH